MDLGLSAYFSSRNAIPASIQVMNQHEMNIYRLPFNNPWQGGPHPFKYEYIEDYLSMCPHKLIVEPFHFWPIGSSADTLYRQNQDGVKTILSYILSRYGNNNRVWIELAAEYQANDLYTLMQDLTDYIRNMGYYNPLVCNIWNQSWQVVDDPAHQFYQGYHFYWDYWSVNGAKGKLAPALDKGIKIMITEGGAHTQERSYFTKELVAEESEFLAYCNSLDLGKTIWMYEDLYNWQTYVNLGLVLPTSGQPPPPECTTNQDCINLHGPNWICQNGVCVYNAPPPPPDCSIASDCLTKYGTPAAGYHWECISQECVQVKDSVEPPPPPPSYDFSKIHAILFSEHQKLTDLGFKVRRKFIGEKIHNMLHPLI